MTREYGRIDAHVQAIKIRAGKMSPEQIAEETGLSPGTVRAYASAAGVSLAIGAGARRRVTVRVSEETLGCLLGAASKRHLTADKLASNLLTVIATDDLFAAVLDK